VLQLIPSHHLEAKKKHLRNTKAELWSSASLDKFDYLERIRIGVRPRDVLQSILRAGNGLATCRLTKTVSDRVEATGLLNLTS
jgi:hypothetical protein